VRTPCLAAFARHANQLNRKWEEREFDSSGRRGSYQRTLLGVTSEGALEDNRFSRWGALLMVCSALLQGTRSLTVCSCPFVPPPTPPSVHAGCAMLVAPFGPAAIPV
jgi:hypothetical protein